MAAAFESPTSVASSGSTPVEQIARSTGSSLKVVQEIYDRELQSLRNNAKITQFVGVIATRRVLLELRGR